MNNDCLSIIFGMLDFNDVVNCMLVNKQFYQVIMHKNVWWKLCQRDYPSCYIELKQLSYYETYKSCFKFEKKLNMLHKLGKLTVRGIRLSQHYDMKSDYEEMKYEYELQMRIIDEQNFNKFVKTVLLTLNQIVKYIQ
jgi:hypothetical protein